MANIVKLLSFLTAQKVLPGRGNAGLDWGRGRHKGHDFRSGHATLRGNLHLGPPGHLGAERSGKSTLPLRSSLLPTNQPTNQPTNRPTYQRTDRPTDQPINETTDQLTNEATINSQSVYRSTYPTLYMSLLLSFLRSSLCCCCWW